MVNEIVLPVRVFDSGNLNRTSAKTAGLCLETALVKLNAVSPVSVVLMGEGAG